jgi:transketolase
VHYGVREHAMGSMMNGMVAHGGVVPIGATYLVFSDYMRPPLRMSAMMGLPVITAYSHDSIGIGTNGPTHQPIEFLASLRAMPNMLVLRPADAVEAAECWEIALERRDGPTSLIFARQAIPTLRADGDGPNRSATGAYVLAEASKAPARVTLIATGSEVQIAVAARETLEQQGVATRVVSMPSFELFAALPADQRRAIIDPSTLRVGIEAAIRQGWDRWIGEDGIFIGMEGYGASGPGDQLYRHFGITAAKTVEAVLARL